MEAFAPKQARMEFKTTQDTKDILSEAALLSGLDLTSFVIGIAEEKARKVIMQHQSLNLNKAEQQRLFDVLINPPAPSDSLKALLRQERLPTR
jgi:uncharacterized protein (DUF1778 family)